MKGGSGAMDWTTARTRLRGLSTATPRMVELGGRESSRMRSSTTPASETVWRERLRRDPTTKCWADGSQAMASG